MTFTKEQSEEIKEQLLKEVDRLPNENKEQIKEYIKALDEPGLEEFLKKNKIQFSDKGLMQETAEAGEPESSQSSPSSSQCVFCSIVKGELPSYKIAENAKAVAILEINPLSKGHALILPREHLAVEKIPKSSLSLAQKIAKKIKKKLKPEDIKIETSSFQGHSNINIVPIYKDVPLKKAKADEAALKQLQSKLETKKRQARNSKAKESSKEIKNEDLSKLPKIGFRIP